MKNFHSLSLLFLPAFFFLLSSSNSMYLHPSFPPFHTPQSQKLCLDDQRSALLQLQHSLNYCEPYDPYCSKAKHWKWNANNTDCCFWSGVSCDANGHVIGLDLSNKGLSGSFHSIFNLQHLQSLNLASNLFDTTLFQYEFDRLPNLTHLNLSKSFFHGQIPMGISYLTRLVSLDLSYQDYYLSLKLEKPDLKVLIQNMTSLTELYLDRVNISSDSSKWCETISMARPNLRVLSMSDCSLTGPLCPSLSKLHFLSHLSLDDNPISYLPPNSLEISSSLVVLSLRSCDLSGHFPKGVFSFPRLQFIDISNNEALVGQLPEFPLNSSLQFLIIEGANFSGKLPESIGNLKLLTKLDLSFNHFDGPIPESIGNLKLLTELELNSNHFDGPIPESIGNLKLLTELDLSSNHFDGPIPESIGNLKLLTEFDLSSNHFDGPIPESIGNLKLMIELDLSYNHVNGPMPESIGNLKWLIGLDLSYNHFDGLIPESIGNLKWLTKLNLGFNYFTGPIPESFVQLQRLDYLDIGYSGFGYVKLDMFFQFKNLKSLDLSNISLSIGRHNKSLTFPQLARLVLSSCNLTKFPEFIKTQDNLFILVLSHNHIQGFVPNWLWKPNLQYLSLSFNPNIDFPKQFPFVDANSSFPMLQSLELVSCNLSKFPEFLKSQERLEYLYLSNNKISGTIPNWVWKSSLSYLDLSNNHLSSLDQSSSKHSKASSHVFLPSPICNMTQLRSFNASYNNLSGSIPNCFGKISALERLDLERNNFTGILPNFAEATHLQVLQVGENRFHGRIPEEIQNLKSLMVLNLSQNSFSGQIPPTLENLKVLQSLDLSRNKLSGKIPPQLTSLTFLAALNLSYNQLEGSIPQRNQFSTFSNDSYRGNPKLCGPPLTRKCNEVDEPEPPHKEHVLSLFGKLL